MDCTEVMEQLSEYLDDDVHADLRRAVDQHLHTCTDCSYYVDTVRKTVVLYQADQRIEVPDEGDRPAAGGPRRRVRRERAQAGPPGGLTPFRTGL